MTMSLQWLDVTIPMRNGMTVWPGDAPFLLEAQTRLAQGDGSNVSRVTMSTHAGTHVDAPWHFEDDGKRLHEVSHEVFFGRALVIGYAGEGPLHADDLGADPLPPRLLVKTRNSARHWSAPFCRDYVALEADAAERCVREGVRLIGVDYLSVAPYKQEGQETHHQLLHHDVFVVEGLVLGAVPEGWCEFVVLPLPLEGADGAPCRAFVGLTPSPAQRD